MTIKIRYVFLCSNTKLSKMELMDSIVENSKFQTQNQTKNENVIEVSF